MYAMSLTKAQQAALGITVATTGVMNGGGDGPQVSTNPSQNISGTSYDENKLYKTQPDSYTNDGPSVRGLMDKISSEGPNAVEPIVVYVDNGIALIVDGHHRYQAFSNLGYDRVPIKYIHQNQISSLYGRTLEELRYMMFK